MKLLLLSLFLSTFTSISFADTLMTEFSENKSGNREMIKMFESEDGSRVHFQLCKVTTYYFEEDKVDCRRFGAKAGYEISFFEKYLESVNNQIDKVEISNSCYDPDEAEFNSIVDNYHLIHKRTVASQIIFPEHFEVKLGNGSSMTACGSYMSLGFDKFKKILRTIVLSNI